MPKIFLKPNSAEYADADAAPQIRVCDMPGCHRSADFKAPKSRSLSEHYTFCLEHVQEYNKAWDFFSGMAQADVEEQIIRSAYWDKPTWRYDGFANLEAELKRRAQKTYHFSDKEPDKDTASKAAAYAQYSPEGEAMAIMGLEPPLTLQGIKNRYKTLVKKHHPDINRDDPKSEELLKSINMAYTILKLAYEKYGMLDDRKR